MFELLAVELDGDGAILVIDGLTAGLDPDDAETAMSKSHAGRE